MADSDCKQTNKKNSHSRYQGVSSYTGPRNQIVTHVWFKDDVMKFLFVIFLGLLSVQSVVGGDPGYSYGHSDGNGSLVMNITEAPRRCPPERECDDGGIAGPVIGALIAGIVIGALIMYVAQRFLQQKKKTLPPKDYDVSGSSHFDVNRNSNNDGSTYITPIEAVDYEDKPDVKGHKKLERLVKPTQRAPVDIEIPSAATPLIHTVESPGEDNPGAATTPVGSTKTDGVNGADPNPSFYSNTGEDRGSSQPYESLDIIPEEVEYENARLNSYEGFSSFSVDPKTKK